MVRSYTAAKACGLKFVLGTEVRLVDGPRLVFLAGDREGYGKLSALITRARRRATKGAYRLERADLGAGLDHCLALLIPAPELPVDTLPRLESEIAWLRPLFPDRLWIAVELLRDGEDDKRSKPSRP